MPGNTPRNGSADSWISDSLPLISPVMVLRVQAAKIVAETPVRFAGQGDAGAPGNAANVPPGIATSTVAGMYAAAGCENSSSEYW